MNWQVSETQRAVKQKQSTPLKWNLLGIALKAFWGLSCRQIDSLEKPHSSWNGAGESHTALNACSRRLLYKSCSASSVRSGLCACCWCSECLACALVVLIPTSYTARCIFPTYISLTALSPSSLLPVLGSRHPAASRSPLSFSTCLTPVSLSSSSSIPSPVLVSFYLYTGLQTFPPMATLAMRAYPWLTGSPHPPLWVPLFLWRHHNLCHFIITVSVHARFNQ